MYELMGVFIFVKSDPDITEFSHIAANRPVVLSVYPLRHFSLYPW
jgi:hypothetical protein